MKLVFEMLCFLPLLETLLWTIRNRLYF